MIDPYSIPHDVLYPIDAEHRYRIYARLGKQLTVLACAATPGGVGEAICQLHADAQEHGRRLADHGMIGVLDVLERDWVLLPWTRPEGQVTFGMLPARVLA